MNETDLKAWVNLGHNGTETRSVKIMFHCPKNAIGGDWKVEYYCSATEPFKFVFNVRDWGKHEHYENTHMQYTEISHGCKSGNFQMKFFDIFLVDPQNIECGYMLEPPCFRTKVRK